MDSQRKVELLRALVKSDVLKENLRVSTEVSVRDTGRKAADLNRQFKLSFPVSTSELLLLFAELLDEVSTDSEEKAINIRKWLARSMPGQLLINPK